MWVRSLGWGDHLEEGTAAHCSVPTWRVPGTEKPGGYSPWGRKESDTTKHEHTGSSQPQNLNTWLMSFLTFTTKGHQFCCHSGDQDPSQKGDYAVHCIPSKQHKAGK